MTTTHITINNMTEYLFFRLALILNMTKEKSWYYNRLTSDDPLIYLVWPILPVEMESKESGVTIGE